MDDRTDEDTRVMPMHAAPRPRGHALGYTILAVVLAAALAGAGAAGLAGHHHTPPPRHHAAVVSTHPLTGPQRQCQALQTWRNGKGFGRALTVQNDLSAAAASLSAGKIDATETTGRHMEADAAAAAALPPPIGTAVYVSVMHNVSRAGKRLSQDNLNGSTAVLDEVAAQFGTLAAQTQGCRA